MSTGEAVSSARFDSVLAEWRAVEAAVGTRQQAELAEVVGRWEPAVDVLRREVADLRLAGRWVSGPADVMGVLHLSRAEIRHSAMVAWLLDPSASHGLGAEFLTATLRRSFPEQGLGPLGTARPECEVPRSGCRADIVVWGDDFTLVIENKVDAPEGAAQCDTLFDRFRDDINPLFLLLCPRAHDRLPRSATGEARKVFRVVTYAAVRQDLHAVLDGSRDDPPGPGRDVAQDYLRTLRRVFR